MGGWDVQCFVQNPLEKFKTLLDPKKFGQGIREKTNLLQSSSYKTAFTLRQESTLLSFRRQRQALGQPYNIKLEPLLKLLTLITL